MSRSTGYTLFVVTMMAAMLSLLSLFCSRERMRHSEGRIFMYKWHSIIVNCLATSRASNSNSFNFLDVLGIIDIGGGSREMAVLVRLSPFCYNSIDHPPTWVCVM